MINEKQEFSRNIIRYIANLERLRRRYLDDNLKSKKLRGPMFLMILYLDRNPGSAQDTLRDFLGIDKSGIARKCRRLEDLGYIIREQSQEDRRQNSLYLTESGKKLLPIIRELLSDWRETVTEGMDENEQKELISLLELMMKNAKTQYSR